MSIILKIIIFSISLSLFFYLYKIIKKIVILYYHKLRIILKRIYRLLNVRKRSEIVWKELITIHKEEIGTLDDLKMRNIF